MSTTEKKSDCPKVILSDGTDGTARDLKFGDLVEIQRCHAREPNKYDKQLALFVRLRRDEHFVDLPVCMCADSTAFRPHMLDIDRYNRDYSLEQLPCNGFSTSGYESIKILSHDGVALFPLINALYNKIRKLEDARKASWKKAEEFLREMLGERPD